jgi:hypothetical protein
MLVRSRNGSGWTLPSWFTTRTRPIRSVTNRRPVPSPALATLVGSTNPSATLTSAIWTLPGMVPPGSAT